MKLVFLIALAVLPARGVIAFTAGTACASVATVSSQACSVGSVTTGQLIWIGLSWAGGGGGTLSVTDGVNTYAQAGTDAAVGTSTKSSIWWTVATTSTTITATATHSASSAFISVSPAIVTGFNASSVVGETPKATNISAQTITCAFTRTGTQMMTVAGNLNVAAVNVGWNTAGSTGTFTLGAIVSNGVASQPLGTAFQRVTSGTTINALLNVTASAGNITCNGFSINEAVAVGPQHKVSQ